MSKMLEDYGLLIDGTWRPSSDGQLIDILSPATNKVVAKVPAATANDVQAALDCAAATMPQWSMVAAWERARILRKTADLLRERVEQLAHVMSAETGKPLAEARGEIGASADQFEWYGEEAKRIYGQVIPSRDPDERLSVVYQPVGPCLALSAWNFPMLLPARKIAAALAAGCTVIARPAIEAPGSCLGLGQALMDAGLPKGALSILTGKSVPMVGQLIDSPVIRKVSLTGSVAVGQEILRQCAAGIKKVTMELGGHAPVIVHADFDLVAAAKKLAVTKFRNCGQVCISPSRFYVHSSIASEFEKSFAEVAAAMVVGDGLDEKTTLGPLIRKSAIDDAVGLIEDAKEKGARLLAGGGRPKGMDDGHFLQPTVLADVPDDARIMIDEPFAPIAPVSSFDSLEEVIERANSTPYGLASYVFTRDSTLAAKTAESLEAGMVGINETLLAAAEVPFGGTKDSGFGREGGSLGILDYLTPKYIKHRLVGSDA